MHAFDIGLYPYSGSTRMASPRGERPREQSTPVPTRFATEELARIERARNLLGLPSRSAFIREAVLERLEEVEGAGILQLRDVDEEAAAKLMDEYLQEHPGIHYVSELVEALGLEPRIAFTAARRLVDAGGARVGRG